MIDVQKIAIICNLLLFVFVVFMIATQGFPRKGEEALMVLLIMVVPVINLIALKWNKEVAELQTELRKAELKKKLDELNHA